MRRLRIILLVVATVALAPVAGSAVPIAYESLTVGATAVGLAFSTLNHDGRQIRRCAGRLETAQVRYRFDGTNPTATEGIVVEIGDWLEIDRHEVATAARFIRTGATSGVFRVHCW
ncbi:MAG TPA: hypothetical protein VNJ04_13840 [Gemmatimonadaceae bacterium]|nr:hypothetical protein [Gemmatimonadaceae bacterium]